MYLKDGNPYSFLDLKKDNPNVGFPQNALENSEIRAEYGIEEVADPEPIMTYAEKRSQAYGSAEDQIEFITENGLAAWQEKVLLIKQEFPKEG